MRMIEAAELIARAAKQKGWRALVVGGWVRDFVARLPSKDLDFEVSCEDKRVSCTVDEVEEWLRNIADNVKAVGKSFGVFDFSIDGIEAQVSMPRKDAKHGTGHKGFVVDVDPYMSIKDACHRRDLTFNSMAFDPLSKMVYDYYGGYQDALDWRIRILDSEEYKKDPLRPLRLIRFSTKKKHINISPYSGDGKLCIFNSWREYETLPKDRLWGEWRKIALSPYPGNALECMRITRIIGVYPMLERLYGIQQSPEFHPEGTVGIHTANAMNKMAMICDRNETEEEDRIVSVLSAMLHDVGKVYADPADKAANYDHAEAGMPIAQEFLEGVGVPGDVCARVYKLVELHMRGAGSDSMGASAVRRLANDLYPATINDWLRLNEADKSSKFMTLHIGMSREAQDVCRLSFGMLIQDDKPQPILMGRHLIELGVIPGKDMGEILRKAYEAQLDGWFDDLDGAKEWAWNEVNEWTGGELAFNEEQEEDGDGLV